MSTNTGVECTAFENWAAQNGFEGVPKQWVRMAWDAAIATVQQREPRGAVQQPTERVPLTNDERHRAFVAWYQTAECQLTPEAIWAEGFQCAEHTHGIKPPRSKLSREAGTERMTMNTTRPLAAVGFSEELGSWRMVCGDWRDDLVAVHDPKGHIASGLTELQARALIDAHNCAAPLRVLLGAMTNDFDRLALRMSHLEELLADQQPAERRSLTNTQKDAELLAWVLACPEMAAEALNDAAAGEGTPRGNLERRMTLYNAAAMTGEN